MAAELLVRVGTRMDAEKELDSFGGKLQSFGAKWTRLGAGMSVGITAPLVAGFAAAVNEMAGFSQEMSVTAQIANASQEQRNALTQQALDLGAKSVFTNKEVAQGMQELAKAGFNATETAAAIPGVLDLAAASGESLETSAKLTAAAMHSFGLQAGDAGTIANTLAAAANSSAADIGDLGLALQQGGTYAHRSGLTLQDFMGTVALLTNYGQKGRVAGTGLTQMFQRMYNPTDKAKKVMQELGISFYDAQGNMKAFPDIIENVRSAVSGLTQEQRDAALSTLFMVQGGRAILPILQEGAAGWQKYVDAASDADAAQRAADARMSGLAGAFKYFTGSVESAVTRVLLPFEGFGADLVRQLGDLVTAVSELPGPWLAAAAAFLAVWAAAGPVITIIGGIATALAFIATPIGATIAILSLLAAAVASNFGGIRDHLANFYSAAKDYAGKIYAAFQNISSAVSIDGLFSEATVAAIEMLPAPLDKIAATALGAAGGIKFLWESLTGMRDAIGAIKGFRMFEQMFGKNAADNLNSFGAGIQTLRSNVISTIDSLRPKFQELLGWISSAAKGDWGPLKAGLNGAIQQVNATIQQFSWDSYVQVLNWVDYIQSIDWAAFIDKVAWTAYLTTLDWVDWLDKLAWNAYVGTVHWPDWLQPLRWEAYVAYLRWSDWVTTFAWNAYVASLSWGDYINHLTWETFVADLVDWSVYVTLLPWNTFVKTLDWTAYILPIVWDQYVKAVDWTAAVSSVLWDTYIQPIDWGSYVPKVDWAATITGIDDWGNYIGDLAWDSFIRQVTWPDFIGRVNWASWIESVDWDALIPHVDWKTFIEDTVVWSAYIAVLPWNTFVHVLDWAFYTSKLLWTDYITNLQWWLYVSQLAWDAFLTVIDWSVFVAEVFWGSYIAVMDWAAYVKPILWDSYVAAMQWSDYLHELFWSTFVSNMEWPTFIKEINWDDFVDFLRWPSAIGNFSWSSFIVNLVWPAIIGDFDWHDWIPHFPGWPKWLTDPFGLVPPQTQSQAQPQGPSKDLRPQIATDGYDKANAQARTLGDTLMSAGATVTNFIGTLSRMGNIPNGSGGLGVGLGTGLRIQEPIEVPVTPKFPTMAELMQTITPIQMPVQASTVSVPDSLPPVKIPFVLGDMAGGAEGFHPPMALPGLDSFQSAVNNLQGWNFQWPDFPQWTWPAYAQWTWPSYPQWVWPEIPAPGWLDRLVVPRPSWLGEMLSWSPVLQIPAGMSMPGNTASGGAVPGNWSGTRNWRGGWTTVGEHGTELVNLPRGTDIYSATESSEMMAQAAQVNINATVTNNIDIQDLVRQVARELRLR